MLVGISWEASLVPLAVLASGAPIQDTFSQTIQASGVEGELMGTTQAEGPWTFHGHRAQRCQALSHVGVFRRT